jgi:hypothetical protein
MNEELQQLMANWSVALLQLAYKDSIWEAKAALEHLKANARTKGKLSNI